MTPKWRRDARKDLKTLILLFSENKRLSKIYYPLYLLPMTAWGSPDPQAGRPRWDLAGGRRAAGDRGWRAGADLAGDWREKHGNTLCHRFLNNECVVRRCLFSHHISTATNVDIICQEARAPAPPSQDFPNLHATQQVMWSQVVAQSPQIKAQALPNMSGKVQNQNLNLEAQVKEVLAQLIPQLITQIVTTLRTINPN